MISRFLVRAGLQPHLRYSSPETDHRRGPEVRTPKAGGGGATFVRDVKSYVERYLDKPGLVPNEHVVVFDEAQRAWDAPKSRASPSQDAGPSRALHSLRGANPEWSVVVGLIGSGQEIHDGEEAGLVQWRWALDAAASPEDWTVVAPPEAAALFEGLRRRPERRRASTRHRTPVSRRVIACISLSIASSLMGSLTICRQLASQLERERYHLRVTRDLATAKATCASGTRTTQRHVSASLLLRAIANYLDLDVANDWNATKNVRKGPWFCDGDEEPFGRSGRALRDCVTEFGCQGLELDGALVASGTDFVLAEGLWTDLYARRYQRPGDIHDAFGLRRNAYRVLLTRGRDATVVFVPPIPVLDETYERLIASGFRELGITGAEGLGADVTPPELNDRSDDAIERLIAAARAADRIDRIEYLDEIANHGIVALPPRRDSQSEPGLGAVRHSDHPTHRRGVADPRS